MQQPIARLGRPVQSDGDMQMESHDGINIWFEREIQPEDARQPMMIDFKRFLLLGYLTVSNARIIKQEV